MSKHLDMARKWLEDPQVKCPHLAYRDARECVICVAALLSEVAKQERERCAAKADEWAQSVSCKPGQGHEDNPCCHVRTGAGIRDAIRALGEDS